MEQKPNRKSMNILEFFQPLLEEIQRLLKKEVKIKQKVYLTRDELMDYVKVKSKSTIDNWQKDGLAYIKGSPNIYDLDDVIEFLNSKKIRL